MTEILILTSILVPIVTGVTEAGKKTFNLPINWVPVVALALGLLLGLAAIPFTDLDAAMRLWAGGLAGLASVGLFEVVKQRDEKSKGPGHDKFY